MEEVGEILEIKGDKVFVIDPDNTVSEAAGALVAGHIGALVVLDDDGGLAGIITERDISRAVNKYCEELPGMRVSELMTRRVITCAPDDTILSAMSLMQSNLIRHLPVLADGELTGIVSIRDVVSVWIDMQEIEIERLQAAAEKLAATG